MKLIKTFATAFLASTLAGSAFAADLPSRKAPPVMVAPAPIFTWTGFYVGANIGYGFGASNTNVGSLVLPPPATANHFANWNGGVSQGGGVLGGGQIGFNWQALPWLVAGVEADFQAADIKSTLNTIGTMPPGNGGTTQFAQITGGSRLDWFGTVRARLGVTIAPTLLLYATGGLAYGDVKNAAAAVVVNSTGSTIFGAGALNSVRTGWTAGAGAEWAFAQNWSAKLEYLYTDLGSSNVPLASFGTSGFYYACCTFVGSNTSSTKFHTVRAGLNYRFGWGAPAAVVAKY